MNNSADLVLPTNTWIWVSLGAYRVVVYQGVTQLADTTAAGTGSMVGRLVLGWGSPARPWVTTTIFPNDSTHKMSKLYVANRVGVVAPLTVDVSTGNVFYACRDSLGPETTLLDSSGNLLPMAAAVQGITVNLEGPYA